MSKHVKIVTNNAGLGDWIQVMINGETISSGYRLDAEELAFIIESCEGFDSLGIVHLTDEQLAAGDF